MIDTWDGVKLVWALLLATEVDRPWRPHRERERERERERKREREGV